MADEFVSTAQFGEFVKRIGERFDHVQKDMANGFAYVNQLADQRYESLNQRLADADKAREQNLVHMNQRFDDMTRGVNQRFDGLEKRMDLFHADMLQMRNWLVRLHGLVAFGFIGAIALILLKDVIFK